MHVDVVRLPRAKALGMNRNVYRRKGNEIFNKLKQGAWLAGCERRKVSWYQVRSLYVQHLRAKYLHKLDPIRNAKGLCEYGHP